MLHKDHRGSKAPQQFLDLEAGVDVKEVQRLLPYKKGGPFAEGGGGEKPFFFPLHIFKYTPWTFNRK